MESKKVTADEIKKNLEVSTEKKVEHISTIEDIREENEKLVNKVETSTDKVEEILIDDTVIDKSNTYEARMKARQAEKRGNVVWEPKSLLDIPPAIKKKLDYEGYDGRWISSHLYEKRILEGWQPVMVGGKRYSLSAKADKFDHPTGTGDIGGSSTRMREMILMKLPREVSEAKREYQQAQTRDLLKSKVDEALPNDGTRTGTITVSKEIEEEKLPAGVTRVV